MPRLPVKYDWPEVVLHLRERRSQTQAEFAAELGCSVSTVSKWERRETVPAPKQRRRMEALGTEAGFPASEWPEESKQTPIFGGAGR
jgi:transcriptional regulator with XRE-family HTH domain